LFSAEQIREVIGLKTGDIANGEALSKGLYESLKTRYAKFGYIQYTADVNPIFHVKEGASEGVVDFTITIDEEQQFKVRTITIVGADRASTDLLQRELLIRNGDIFDDELLRESLKRASSTGLVDPIDAEKDIDYRQPDQKAPVMDLIIHVNRHSRL
jgi:outer membrane protein assembly factor BamA